MLAAVCQYTYNNYREVLLVKERDEVSTERIDRNAATVQMSLMQWEGNR